MRSVIKNGVYSFCVLCSIAHALKIGSRMKDVLPDVSVRASLLTWRKIILEMDDGNVTSYPRKFSLIDVMTVILVPKLLFMNVFFLLKSFFHTMQGFNYQPDASFLY